jgi:hypothetical protein
MHKPILVALIAAALVAAIGWADAVAENQAGSALQPSMTEGPVQHAAGKGRMQVSFRIGAASPALTAANAKGYRVEFHKLNAVAQSDAYEWRGYQ